MFNTLALLCLSITQNAPHKPERIHIDEGANSLY